LTTRPAAARCSRSRFSRATDEENADEPASAGLIRTLAEDCHAPQRADEAGALCVPGAGCAEALGAAFCDGRAAGAVTWRMPPSDAVYN
jgi:hypothetical protein